MKNVKRNIFLKFVKYISIVWFLIALRHYKSLNIEVIDCGAGYYYCWFLLLLFTLWSKHYTKQNPFKWFERFIFYIDLYISKRWAYCSLNFRSLEKNCIYYVVQNYLYPKTIHINICRLLFHYINLLVHKKILTTPSHILVDWK